MKPLGEPTEITIHHSASPLKTTVADITKWHTDPKPKGKGWPHIGYHYVIDGNAKTHVGRSLRFQGAHCPPNKHRIGICAVGNNCAKRSHWKHDQIDALEDLVTALITVFPGIKLVRGHRDTGAATECPGCDIGWDGLLEKQWLS